LNALDNNEVNAFFLNSRRSDGNAERHTLLVELESKLAEYGRITFDHRLNFSPMFIGPSDSMLESYFRQIERPRPQERSVKSVLRWLKGNKPLVVEESSFLNTRDDLTSPAKAATRSSIETFVESCAVFLHNFGIRSV
jgi:hypothetical protein